jgi:hypothetical protein
MVRNRREWRKIVLKLRSITDFLAGEGGGGE